MTPRDILAAAKIRVVNRHPYFAKIMMSLRPVEMKGLGTLGVDKHWRLYYDPDKVVEWGVGGRNQPHDGTSAVCAHEVNHVLRCHFDRRQGRDEWLWLLAADAAINDDLAFAGWRLPGVPVLPKTFGAPDRLSEEELYEYVKNHADKNPPPGKGAIVEVEVGVPGCRGRCGSASGGKPLDCEIKDGTQEEIGKNGQDDTDESCSRAKDGPSLPDPVPKWEQDVIRRQVAEDIVKEMARNPGSIPRGVKAWAEKELRPPTIPWQQKLAALTRGAVAERAGASDYTYRRVSRKSSALRSRFGARAPIVPSLRTPIPEVGVVLDVSGSMVGTPQEEARSEIMGIVRAIGCPTKVYVTDVVVAEKKRVGSLGDVVKLSDTCGGTDLRSGIMAADVDRADVIIVLSDGYTPWTEPGEVRARLIACITSDGDEPPAHIPHVRIGGEKEAKK